MRKFKKFLAVLLIVVLTIGNSVSVFAGEIDLPVETSDLMMDDLTDESSETALSETISDGTTSDDKEIPLEIQSEDEESIEEISESVEENESVEDEETEDEEIEDEEIEGSYPGVDLAGFCENSEILKDKELLSDNLDGIENLIPDKDYIEGEIIVAAPDEETAEIYAEGFGGKLGAYCHGFCLILLDTDDKDDDGYCLSVADAVKASADYEVPLPAAYPNYIGEWTSDETYMDEAYMDETYMGETYTDEVYYDEESAQENNVADWESAYNDPYLNASSTSYQYQHSLMQTESAWRAGFRGQDVKVAVLDSGAREGHEDLTIAGKGVYKNNKFSTITDTMTDSVGHGTHCCGIVAAKADNSKGGAGIAPGALLYAGKVDIDGSPSDWGLYCAMQYATYNWKVDIMSISIGINGTYYSADLTKAVKDAYEAGVAVFVSSGNEWSNTMGFPAKCKYAIPVGAVNSGNGMTDFSNLASGVRYSGPGYAIYSTYNESNSSYKVMDGTSMACPAVAGAAAVILSSGKVEGTGKQKVNNLLALMDKGATPSGVGKGTPNLAKSLGLSSTTSAPNAPTTMNAPGVINKASTSVTLNSAFGTKIYYNINGANITYKNGQINNASALGSNNGTITLYATDGAKQVVKAVAIDDYTGLCSKMVSFTYTFKPKLSAITITSKTLDFYVTKGSSIQLGVTASPACAKIKTVKWSIPSTNGVSINEKTGKLTVSKDVSVSSVKVTANATGTNGGSASQTQTITISKEAKVKSITPSAKNISLYTSETATITVDVKNLAGKAVSAASNTKTSITGSSVETASLSGNTLTIKAATIPGKATVNIFSTDGTYKKASITINTLQAVTGVSYTKPGSIVQGGSFRIDASATPANASNKNLIWSLTKCSNTPDLKTCGVSINSKSGQIKVAKNAVTGTYTAKWQAADSKAKSGTFTFNITNSASKITSINLSSSSVSLFRVTNNYSAPTENTVTATVSGGNVSDLAISNSAPGIVTASISSGKISLTTTGKATGSANITVYTKDGTNLKKTIKVKVSNPPTALILSLPKGKSDVLAYGKSMKLNATFVTDNGPIDASSKKLEWTSSAPSYITVSNGTIKTVSRFFNAGSKVRITAKATDGSGVIGSIDIYPNPKTCKLNVSYGNNSVSLTAVNEGYRYFNASVITPLKVSVSGPSNQCICKLASYGFVTTYNFIYYAPGIYTIKFTMNDGSNVSKTVRIKVR